MNCGDAQGNCELFLDGQVEAPAASEIETHLAECPRCAEHFRTQRAFHQFLARTLLHSAGAAPAELRARILVQGRAPATHAAASANVVRLHAPRSVPRIQGPVAVAACLMLGMSGLLGFQTACTRQQCPLVMAAQHEHLRISSGAREMFACAENSAAFFRSAGKDFERFAAAPDLLACHLKCAGGGVVDVPGLSKGVFLKYNHCHCGMGNATLLIVKSDKMPGGEVVPVHDKQFVSAAYGGNNVLSWRSEKSGLVFILVSEQPLRESLELAELASR